MKLEIKALNKSFGGTVYNLEACAREMSYTQVVEKRINLTAIKFNVETRNEIDLEQLNKVNEILQDANDKLSKVLNPYQSKL